MNHDNQINKKDLKTVGVIIALIVIMIAAGCWILYQRAMQTVRSDTCKASLKQVASCLSMYTDDWHGNFPPPRKWTDILTRRYLYKNFDDWCVVAPGGIPTYAINAKLNGLSMNDVKDPAHTVLLFESVPGKNLSGGPELFPNPPRHPDGYAVAFVDGHVVRVKSQDISKLNWDPVKKMKR